MNPRGVLDMFRRKGGTRCTEIGRQIQTYLDGGLDAAAATKVSDHLDACRRCGLTANDYRHLKRALAETAAPIPDEPLRRLKALAAELASGEKSPA
ncbi:MAG: zf-HC2 domain-containing protein [Ilumatobacteraceae bacterium]